MNYKVVITERAKTDLYEIYEYIAFTLHAQSTAERIIKELESGIMSLDKMPFRFKLFDSEPWRSRNVHVMSVERYLVFYIPDNTSASVTIIRVMYGGRDVEKQLN